MISKAAVSKVIDVAQAEFEKCWAVLSVLKDGPISSFSPKGFLDFQPTLASALFLANEMYLSLSQERKRTIARKKSLLPHWFENRLKTIASYQKALKQTIEIGKALGDSFAWAFYQNERGYLDQHFAHERITHLPPGIGGRGELEFIRRVREIKGQFVLYHGMTTFLRLGDITLIDLQTMTVTAIGDLKTKKGGPNELQISLYLTGPSAPERFPLNISYASASGSMPQLLPDRQEKLERQLKKMGDSFNIKKPDFKIQLNDSTEMQCLDRIAAGLNQARVVYEKAGDGLMLIGIKSWRRNRLSTKLLGRTTPNFDRAFADLEAQVKLILDTDQTAASKNENSIFVGHLTTETLLGTVPLFWWPVQTDFLRKLFFQDAFVVTLYNPLHLMTKLRSLGYEVQPIGDGRRRKITKAIGRTRMVLHRMEYFEQLVKEHLVSEDTIIAILADMLQKAEAGQLLPNSEITLALYQHITRPRTP